MCDKTLRREKETSMKGGESKGYISPRREDLKPQHKRYYYNIGITENLHRDERKMKDRI